MSDPRFVAEIVTYLDHRKVGWPVNCETVPTQESELPWKQIAGKRRLG